GASVYSATKHAVVALSEGLYYELEPSGILVTAVNPGFSETEGFSGIGRRTPISVEPQRVADVIVDVVRRGIAPEIAVPRWVSPLQAFRVLTPRLYRWGVGVATRLIGRR